MGPWHIQGLDPWATSAAGLLGSGGAMTCATGPSQSAAPPQAACPAAAWAPAEGADYVDGT
eukprot:2971452-Pyramimonas_sp.AAC.1